MPTLKKEGYDKAMKDSTTTKGFSHMLKRSKYMPVREFGRFLDFLVVK